MQKVWLHQNCTFFLILENFCPAKKTNLENAFFENSSHQILHQNLHVLSVFMENWITIAMYLLRYISYNILPTYIYFGMMKSTAWKVNFLQYFWPQSNVIYMFTDLIMCATFKDFFQSIMLFFWKSKCVIIFERNPNNFDYESAYDQAVGLY